MPAVSRVLNRLWPQRKGIPKDTDRAEAIAVFPASSKLLSIVGSAAGRLSRRGVALERACFFTLGGGS